MRWSSASTSADGSSSKSSRSRHPARAVKSDCALNTGLEASGFDGASASYSMSSSSSGIERPEQFGKFGKRKFLALVQPDGFGQLDSHLVASR